MPREWGKGDDYGEDNDDEGYEREGRRKGKVGMKWTQIGRLGGGGEGREEGGNCVRVCVFPPELFVFGLLCK